MVCSGRNARILIPCSAESSRCCSTRWRARRRRGRRERAVERTDVGAQHRHSAIPHVVVPIRRSRTAGSADLFCPIRRAYCSSQRGARALFGARAQANPSMRVTYRAQPRGQLENGVSLQAPRSAVRDQRSDRKSTRVNSSHVRISYAVFCLKKKNNQLPIPNYIQSICPDATWCPSNIEFIRRINGLDSLGDVPRIVFISHSLTLVLASVHLC